MDDQHGIDCGCEEYNELSRRQFITASAGVSAAAFFPAWLPKIVMMPTSGIEKYASRWSALCFPWRG